MKKSILIVSLLISLCFSGISNDSLSIKSQDTVAFFFLKEQIIVDSSKTQFLYYKVYEWLGTRYKYAGETKQGIDCSGFVSQIYSSVFCVPLSGGSSDIFKEIAPLKKEELQEGDLVFFKIKKGRISHVGIYLQNNKFAHASIKKGVIISDLNDDYYKKYFYRGGRLKGDSLISNDQYKKNGNSKDAHID